MLEGLKIWWLKRKQADASNFYRDTQTVFFSSTTDEVRANMETLSAYAKDRIHTLERDIMRLEAKRAMRRVTSRRRVP